MKRKNTLFPTPAEHVIQLQEEVAKLEERHHQFRNDCAAREEERDEVIKERDEVIKERDELINDCLVLAKEKEAVIKEIMPPPPRKRKKEEEEEEVEEHHFPTAAELGMKNQGSKNLESLQTKCTGFDPRIATLDVIKAGSDALINLPCNATTLKGCCKRPDCKSFIKTYTSVDEWNAHLALHKMTPRNLVSINDSANQLRTTMAKKYFAVMADKFLGKEVSHAVLGLFTYPINPI
jgi:hypothetical protein